MTYKLCDRCGARIHEHSNQSNITVSPNYNVREIHRTSVDLCETCTEQFFSHFMKNHWSYKKDEEVKNLPLMQNNQTGGDWVVRDKEPL